jgi:hypothetical protein
MYLSRFSPGSLLRISLLLMLLLRTLHPAPPLFG